ncbi:MAG: virulence protein SciE type [Gemmatimonadaceae bacterium]|nr:virulence protein SciE type [Gemmatimonadaceae bacterium]
MSVQSLFAAGRLKDAIDALGQELRSHPTDPARRAFLFELCSFAGEWDKAGRQLDVIAQGGEKAEAGTLLYRAAIMAERVREHMFDTGDFPTGPAPEPVTGTLNGQPFSSIRDADPRIGARLEVMAGGRYLWIPFAHLAGVTMEPPARLRDLHWAPAHVAVGPGLRDQELGEVLLPALTPAAWRHSDDEIRLGRATDWDELPDGEFVPVGQKVLLVDDRHVPLLDVRELRFGTA